MSQLPVSLFGLSEGQFLESIGGWKVGSVCGPLLLFLRFSEGRAGKRAQKTGPTFLQGLVVANFEPFAISATWGAQASAIWGWSNWLLAEAARGGKAALLLNLDETSVHLAFTHCGWGHHDAQPNEGLDAICAAASDKSRTEVLFHKHGADDCRTKNF